MFLSRHSSMPSHSLRPAGRIAFGLILAAELMAGCRPPDVVLLPPEPAEGFQLETDSFGVGSDCSFPLAGCETRRCFFFSIPRSDQNKPILINRIKTVENPGTTFFVISRVGVVRSMDPVPGTVQIDHKCFDQLNTNDWERVFVDRTGSSDFKLPPDVAWSFQSGETLMLQIHYVNAGPRHTPGNGKGIANFYYPKPEEKPTVEAGGLLFRNNDVRVCPGETDKTYEKICGFPSPVTIAAVEGEFNSRGTLLEMRAALPLGEPDAAGNMPPMQVLPETLYRMTDSLHPPPYVSLNTVLPANGGIDMQCHYTVRPEGANGETPAKGPNLVECGNPLDNCCYTFGTRIDNQEACNSTIIYYPRIPNLRQLCPKASRIAH